MIQGVLCIQCTCSETGETGDFLRDPETRASITPIFDDLAPLWDWLIADGWVQSTDWDLRQKFPTGVYEKATP